MYTINGIEQLYQQYTIGSIYKTEVSIQLCVYEWSWDT